LRIKFRPFVVVTVFLGTALVLLLFYASFLNQPFISHESGSIILVVNSDSKDDFSTQVRLGSESARQELIRLAERAPSVVIVDIHISDADEAQRKSDEVMRQIFRATSRRRVLGVISGGTTLTDPPVIAACDYLKIPLLLAVTTNDNILKLSHSHNVFRLPPNDSRQAGDIAIWAEEFKSIAVFYEDNEYGRFLYSAVSDSLSLRGVGVYGYKLGANSEISSVLSYPTQYATNALVYLGYSAGSRDFLQKLDGTKNTLPVLLSDGCYSPWLLRHASQATFPMYLSFPVEAEGPMGLQEGYRSFGYDGFLLLCWLRIAMINNAIEDTELPSLLSLRFGDQVKLPRLTRQYEFNFLGEQIKSRFSVVYLGGTK
jgi:hypothetical protein